MLLDPGLLSRRDGLDLLIDLLRHALVNVVLLLLVSFEVPKFEILDREVFEQ